MLERTTMLADSGTVLALAIALGLFISLVASSIPVVAVAFVRWIRSSRQTVSVKIKTGPGEVTFSLDNLNAQDALSIIELLKDKGDGRTAKS